MREKVEERGRFLMVEKGGEAKKIYHFSLDSIGNFSVFFLIFLILGLGAHTYLLPKSCTIVLQNNSFPTYHKLWG